MRFLFYTSGNKKHRAVFSGRWPACRQAGNLPRSLPIFLLTRNRGNFLTASGLFSRRERKFPFDSLAKEQKQAGDGNPLPPSLSLLLQSLPPALTLRFSPPLRGARVGFDSLLVRSAFFQSAIFNLQSAIVQAGDGNRTHTASLEGWRTTIMQLPLYLFCRSANLQSAI